MSIYKKLAQFQDEILIIDKDSKGYGYSYASFDNIIEKIKPVLKKTGLVYTHLFDGNTIKCILADSESGDTLESRLELVELEAKGMNASQAQGAAITYARRYTLTSILGLVTDEDTDANIAKRNGKEPAPYKDKLNDIYSKSQKQAEMLQTLADKYSIESISEISESQAKEFIQSFKK